MIKYLLLILVLGFAEKGIGQDAKQELYKTLNSETSKVSNDIYNPINFTNITERMPTENGKVSKSIWNPWSSLIYIKKGSNIYIDFQKEFIDGLGADCDIQIIAYLQRKDKSIKPLAVSGFTKIMETDENIQRIKQNSLEVSDSTKIGYMFSVIKESTNGPSYSGEISLVDEDINEEDKIILQIQNTKKNNTGFTQTFVYDDFGDGKIALQEGLVSLKLQNLILLNFRLLLAWGIHFDTNHVNQLHFGYIFFHLVLDLCCTFFKMEMIPQLEPVFMPLHFIIWLILVSEVQLTV